MNELEKSDQLEEKLRDIIKQKTNENEVLKKLLERLKNDSLLKKDNNEKANKKKKILILLL